MFGNSMPILSNMMLGKTLARSGLELFDIVRWRDTFDFGKYFCEITLIAKANQK